MPGQGMKPFIPPIAARLDYILEYWTVSPHHFERSALLFWNIPCDSNRLYGYALFSFVIKSIGAGPRGRAERNSIP